MFTTCYEFVTNYLKFYQKYFVTRWQNLTLGEYGVLIICIGIFGYILMKSAGKK